MKNSKIVLFVLLFSPAVAFSQFYVGTTFYSPKVVSNNLNNLSVKNDIFMELGLNFSYQFNKENYPLGSLNTGVYQYFRNSVYNNSTIDYTFLRIPLLYKLSFKGLMINDKVVHNFNIGIGYSFAFPVDVKTELPEYNTKFVNHGAAIDLSFDFYTNSGIKTTIGYQTNYEFFSTKYGTTNSINFTDGGFYIGISIPIQKILKIKY